MLSLFINQNKPPIIIANTTIEQTIIEHVNEYVNKGMSVKDSIKEVAKLRNLKKNEVYAEYHQKDG